MNRTIRTAAGMLLVGLFVLPAARATGNAATSVPNVAVERLGELVSETMPLGRIFESLAKDDPSWPVSEKPEAVTPAQLACLRGELGVAGYRRAKVEEVRLYAAANPSRIASDVKLLESGAAAVMARLVMAGAESERTGTQVSEQQVLSASTPEQLASFMTFMSLEEHAGLRELAGIGEAVNVRKSREENERSGEERGGNLAMQWMLRAMGTCKVPSSVLFD